MSRKTVEIQKRSQKILRDIVFLIGLIFALLIFLSKNLWGVEMLYNIQRRTQAVAEGRAFSWLKESGVTCLVARTKEITSWSILCICLCTFMCVYMQMEARNQCYMFSSVIFHILLWDRLLTEPEPGCWTWSQVSSKHFTSWTIIPAPTYCDIWKADSHQWGENKVTLIILVITWQAQQRSCLASVKRWNCG